jgi:hypothetical protein
MTNIMHSDVWSNCSHSTDFHASPQKNCLRQTHCTFDRHHLVLLPAWSWTPKLLPLELCHQQGIWNMFCQYWWLKTANSGVHSRDPLKSAMCYNELSTTAAGVHWTTWWSPTKCHIQTAKNMNSHGHGKYLTLLISFPLCLKMLFHFRNCQVSLATPVYFNKMSNSVSFHKGVCWILAHPI